MSMREDVMTCLRERLLNQTDSGPVFERDEDYMQWLVGSEEAGQRGLINDPGAALRRSIRKDGGHGAHPGVELSPREERQIRDVISRVKPGGSTTGMTANSAVMLMGSSAFIGPLLAAGGY